MGYEQKQNDDADLRALIERLTKIDHDFDRKRQEIRNAAQVDTEQFKNIIKNNDKHHKKSTLYKKGDLVFVRVLQSKPGIN